MKKTMRMIGLGMLACVCAQTVAYGLDRQWTGTDTTNNKLMTRNQNWVGVRPIAGDYISFTSASIGWNKPNMNDDFLTELLRARTSLAQDITMEGGASNNLRLRSTSGLAIENNSGQLLWIDFSGSLRQDNDIFSTSVNASEVTWRTAGSNSVLKVTPGSITLECDLLLDVDGISSMEIGSSISGYATAKGWDITKIGTGTLTLSGSSILTGYTTISQGTLQLGANQPIGGNSDLVFADGTTLKTGGYDGDFDKVDVSGTVIVDFENVGTSQISFKDSSAVAWGTPALNITNFTDGVDSVRFGTDANGLTPTQLAGITVNGVSGYALDSDGYLALPVPADEQEWVGGTNTDWHIAANWASNSVPGAAGVAIFDAAFASSNSQPTVTSNAVVDELRVLAPEQDVEITVASSATLGVAQASINMANAASNLTIFGEGAFVQLPGTESDPLWDVASTNGGDLAIDTDSFVISNGVALTINVDALRTVDIQTSADVSTASVTKTGEGLLILGGSNGWSGDTTISGGTLQLTADNALSSDSAVVFSDGTTLEAEGVSGSFSTLEINGSVTFDLDGAGTNALAFADSSGVAWGSTLVITNYTDGVDSIRFGTNSTALTEAQLADITLNGEGNLVLDESGYLVVGPVPVGDVALGTVSGVGVSLAWGSVVGQGYEVQYKTNLLDAVWMSYTNLAGTGGELSVTSSVVNAAEFYRIESAFSE
ncbi:hypothetical protein PDESU_00883 [Pontiella desulfatans]|uniref:Uncharacterized protein n=1 Tax=Pontiella desulfatans TaxID=2750659 RepID=A0A6C2TYA3_PONDE|nr:autotransporter-associated beta strand repeat-containing protein [Pontiella desulfatans]VGO12331.1 hypothetical protein PDESU_00883 [Pontiella desulfatans]